MDTASARASSTAVAPVHLNGLSVLSLDGGGIRGLSILFIVQHLMEHVRLELGLTTTPLPCELFDFIIGSSTGGLIALMLGRLRMSVDDAIDAYLNLSEQVFGKVKFWRWLPLSKSPRYSARNLERAVQKVAKDVPLADPDPTVCRVAVVAVKQRAADDAPDLLRTYEPDLKNLKCTVVDAARATTAATTFFSPAIIEVRHGLKVTYLDGGLGHNNPAQLCIQEVDQVWGTDRRLRAIVSIGCGTSPNVYFKGSKRKLSAKLAEIQRGSERVHHTMETKYGGRQGVYFRLDVPTDLNSIGLYEWTKLQEVGELTHAYITRESVKFIECVQAITTPSNHSDIMTKRRVSDRESVFSNNIPPLLAPPGWFKGRIAEITDILSEIENRAIAIIGDGGVGKSALGIALLHQPTIAEKYGAFRFFVRCDMPISGSGQILSSNAREKLISIIAANLNITAADGRVDDAVVTYFSRRPSILVLDNLENLYDESSTDFDEFLRRLIEESKLTLIVTMRGTMLPPIGERRWYRKTLGTLDSTSARDVFLSISEVGGTEEQDLDEILKAVDNLPLAIVLLARQATAEFTLKQILSEWKRRRTQVLQDYRDRPGISDSRSLSVNKSIQLSLDRPMMTPSARILLSQLSVLPDGMCIDHLEALCPTAALAGDEPRPEMILQRLSLASIDQVITHHEITGAVQKNLGIRLRIHTCTREYIRELDSRNGRQEPLSGDPILPWQRLLLDHYLQLATRGEDMDNPKLSKEAHDLLLPEINNLESVTIYALTNNYARSQATRAAAALCIFGYYTGVTPTLVKPFSHIVANVDDPEEKAHSLYCLGRLALRRGKYTDARSKLEEAISLYDDVGNFQGIAHCIRNLGEIALHRSEYADARYRFEEAIPLYDVVDDQRGKAHCIRHLGEVLLRLREYTQAQGRFEEAVLLYDGVDDLQGKAHCIRNLGQVALGRRDYSHAQNRFEEAIPLYSEVEDRRGRAHCFLHLGEIALGRRNYAEARKKFEDAMPLYDEVEDLPGKAHCILKLGEVSFGRSDYEDALVRFEEAAPLYDRMEDPQGQAHCVRNLGKISLRRRNYAEARRRFEIAMPLYEEADDLRGKAHCTLHFGEIAFGQREYAETRRRFEAAATLYDDVEDRQGKAHCIRSLGEVALDQGDYSDASSRFEKAALLYDEVEDFRGKAHCILNLGELALGRRDFGEALGRIEEAMLLYDEVEHLLGKAHCVRKLGKLALYQRKYADARASFKDAMAMYESAEDLRGKAHCIRHLGEIALYLRDYKKARRKFEEAMALYDKGEDLPWSASCARRLNKIATKLDS